MKVEATWRGPGRLEVLISGVGPQEADELLESIGASVVAEDEPPIAGPVGWAVGFTGGQFAPPTWPRWSGRYMSVCHRWRADAATGPFRPFLEDEHACRQCEAAAWNLAMRLLDHMFGAAEEINGDERCPTYMHRWILGSVGPVKFYIHRFQADDWSRDLHDHPKRFVSIGLRGHYWEFSQPPTGGYKRFRKYQAPWVRSFPATHRHRLVVTPGETCWTLVVVGPPQRDWGFWHDERLVPFREYVYGPLGDLMKACV